MALADPSRLVLLAPLIFLAHVAEEAPGFVSWFNSLVRPGISQQLFSWVNGFGFLITVAVTASLALSRDRSAALLAVAWLGFLMLGNAVLHVTATLALGRYSPGTATAVALYLPYFLWFLWLTVKRYDVGLAAAIGVSVAGALPMLIHGYFIIFEGRRIV
jgi:Protein of unknown function with HXXEE motif